MDLAQIYHKANLLIAQTYGLTGIPEKGYVIVFVNDVKYIVHFYRMENGWNIEKVEEYRLNIVLYLFDIVEVGIVKKEF